MNKRLWIPGMVAMGPFLLVVGLAPLVTTGDVWHLLVAVLGAGLTAGGAGFLWLSTSSSESKIEALTAAIRHLHLPDPYACHFGGNPPPDPAGPCCSACPRCGLGVTIMHLEHHSVFCQHKAGPEPGA